MRRTKRGGSVTLEDVEWPESDAGFDRLLLGFLNNDLPSMCGNEDSRLRITELLKVIQSTNAQLALLDPLPEPLLSLDLLSQPDAIKAYDQALVMYERERCGRSLREINLAFQEVRLVPSLQRTRDGRSLFVLETLLERGNIEQMAMLVLLRLIRAGDIMRLRRCKVCATWFIAYSRIDAESCSDNCRKNAHARKPEVKAARRANYNSALAKRKREANHAKTSK